MFGFRFVLYSSNVRRGEFDFRRSGLERLEIGGLGIRVIVIS